MNTNTLPCLSLLAAAVLSLSACNNNSRDTSSNNNLNTPSFATAAFLRANNGPSNAGTVDKIDQNGMIQSSFISGANEGLALDASGQLYQAGDSTDSVIRAMCTVEQRLSTGAYSDQLDRAIEGANTGLVNPKGIAIAHQAGLLMAANLNASQITVFGTTAAGNVAPLAVTSLAVAPWDLAYDEANDRLYVALTDGTIAVYDTFVATGMIAASADRIITPADSNNVKISVNTHGIAYDAAGDRLVVSDVGSAADATDGAIFVITQASTVSGMVTVQRRIAGSASMLGNPVDIVLSGNELRVAEKSNDALLVYADIFSGPSGDIAPDTVIISVKPESLVEIIPTMSHPDVSDSIDATQISAVAASSNPSTAGPTSAEVARFSTALAKTASFDAGLGLESVTFDLLGDAYATFDDGVSGGILVANRVANARDTEAYTESRDRQISGPATGLVAPKGLDVATRLGLIFVAENNPASPGILVFSSCASGNVSPLLTLQMTGGARPWDVDYDEATDSAYVSLTNGSVAVFENLQTALSNGTPTITAETRLITPTLNGLAVPAPTNLHGIDFDSASGKLLVSDVGDAASASDGKLYVIDGTVNGLTPITVNITGPSSQLGNPVDIMFDGSSVYVAEKSNNLVMRFDNILSSMGGDVSATASIGYTAPESVALIPQYLSAQPGE